MAACFFHVFVNDYRTKEAGWLKKTLKYLATLQKKHSSHNFKNFLNACNNSQTHAFFHPQKFGR
jgi:hypothetical protein